VSKCSAITRAGGQCKGLVPPRNEYCHAHNPARSEQRRKAASKAGRAKPSSELRKAKVALKQLAEDVLAGRVDRADGSVVAQIYGVYLRAIEAERRIKETEELETRLAELEHQQGGLRWGT
jgi:hypothetical protein